MTDTRLYMDWNATAPLDPAARDAVLSALALPGNASSVHREGRAARAVIEAARRDVAALVATKPAHVIFTSGATEAASLVLTPSMRMGRAPLAIGHLYVSAIEHPALRSGGRFPADRITEIKVTASGMVDLEALEALLAAHDAASGLPMVAVMLANNETGIVQPVAEVGEIVRRAGGVFVVDAVQGAGRLPLSFEAIGCDFLILSSHKIGGPKGAGALVSAGEVMMPTPLIAGGGQEKGHRSGTENVAAIAGFGAAARVAAEELAERNVAIARRRDEIETGMRRIAPDVIFYGVDGPRLPNTSFFTLPGLPAETGQIAFDLEGVALSAGSACSSGKVGESHVLVAMGQNAKRGALRLSIGPTTSDADAERFLGVFERIAARRRKAHAA
ncbi:cysteine desulfurase family protein [Rhizobium sp. RU20A]|uniref:cysteine desulfurase family protein n=1 Tax=Rhizobium sp. RU20A TaxID=1907412 RepID=UPI00122D337A|nr:cysteine desulfurase family protein [Rhizobium sp. RU20A]